MNRLLRHTSMKTINLKIITIDEVSFNEDVTSITVPTANGFITVLPDHIPLVSVLTAGIAVIRTVAESGQSAGVSRFKISDGVLEIRPGNQAFLLVHSAEKVE